MQVGDVIVEVNGKSARSSELREETQTFRLLLRAKPLDPTCSAVLGCAAMPIHNEAVFMGINPAQLIFSTFSFFTNPCVLPRFLPET